MGEGSTPDLSLAVYTRLRGLLSSLPPETCAKIMAALEQANSAGESFPGAEMIRAELAAVIASRPSPARRTAVLQRQFFMPVEPFLIDETLPEKRVARIERSSLTPLWNWLSRDAVPSEIAAYEQNGDLLALTQAIMPTLRQAVAAPDAILRKTIMQMGGPKVFDDLRDMLLIYQSQELLKSVGERVPGPIRQLDDHHTRLMVATLAPFARGNSPLLPFAAAVLMSKLSVPWQIIRVATAATESDSGTLIAGSPFRAVIEIALADVERLMARAEKARSNRQDAMLATATTDFAAYIKALLTEIELSPEQVWTKRLAALRARMAQLLQPELEALPGRIRALLRIRPREQSGRKAAIDEHERNSIESHLSILMVARSSASELALNEVTLRVLSDVQSYLDTGINPLVEGLRSLTGEDRTYRLLQLDAAVKVAHRVRGAAFATLLAKAIDVASTEKRPVARTA